MLAKKNILDVIAARYNISKELLFCIERIISSAKINEAELPEDGNYDLKYFVSLIEKGIKIRFNRIFSNSLYFNIEKYPSEDILINQHTLFDPLWYDGKYLQNDPWRGKPFDHYDKFGVSGLLSPNSWIDSEDVLKINNHYENIGCFGDQPFKSVIINDCYPSLLKPFSSILLCGDTISLTVNEFFNGQNAVSRKIANFFDLPEDTSVKNIFDKIATGNIQANWLNYDDFYAVNTSLPQFPKYRLLYKYLKDFISKHVPISRYHSFAPKDFDDLLLIKSNANNNLIESTKQKSTKAPLVISLVYFNNNQDEISKFIKGLERAIDNYNNKLFTSFVFIIHLNSSCAFDLNTFECVGINRRELIGDSLNIGFGRAHNYVFQYAESILGSEFYFHIVNPDGVLHPDAYEVASKFIRTRDKYSAFEMIHMPVPHPKVYNYETGETSWFSCASVILFSDSFRNVGMFDSNIFLYCEDVEISFRFKMHGYKMYTIANSIFWHDTIDRDNQSRYPVMISAAMYVSKKYNSFKSYMKYYNTLKDLPCNIHLSTANFNKPNNFYTLKDIDFRDLHFSVSRSFKF